MIVEQMTLRVKNIIFFKAVCVCISLVILSYLINSTSDELQSCEERNIAATNKLIEEENRLNALKEDNAKLQEVIQTYQSLKQNQELNLAKNCFDKASYQNKILASEKEFGLNDSSTIKVSEQAPSKINKLQKTIILNKASVLVEYHLDNFLNSIRFAQRAYETMPKNTVINSFEVTKHTSLTPVIASWLDKSDDVDLISVSLDMELRTIGLSDAK